MRNLAVRWHQRDRPVFDAALWRRYIVHAVRQGERATFDREAYLIARAILALLADGLDAWLGDARRMPWGSSPQLERRWQREGVAYREIDAFVASQMTSAIRR